MTYAAKPAGTAQGGTSSALMDTTTGSASNGAAVSAQSVRVLAEAQAHGATHVDEPTAKRLLAALGVPVPEGRVVHGEDSVAAALEGLAPPYALKAVSPRIVHKSDLGAVRLALHDAAEVTAALASMRTALAARGHDDVDTWLVERMAPAGTEVVVGGLQDPEFGPMVMVGLGGVFVEVLGDVSFRICPITTTDAYEMLTDLRGVALLQGARGRAPVDLRHIVDVLMAVAGEGGLMMACAGYLKELDLNPVIISAHGACVADARMILEPSTAVDDTAREPA